METMHATEAMLYRVWLHDQYRAATGANVIAMTNREKHAQWLWQTSEGDRGRDFLAEWRARRGG